MENSEKTEEVHSEAETSYEEEEVNIVGEILSNIDENSRETKQTVFQSARSSSSENLLLVIPKVKDFQVSINPHCTSLRM